MMEVVKEGKGSKERESEGGKDGVSKRGRRGRMR